jgi:hypothetical protein
MIHELVYTGYNTKSRIHRLLSLCNKATKSALKKKVFINSSLRTIGGQKFNSDLI